MSKQEFPIAMRHPHKEDIAFIFNSWLHSYRHSLHVKNIGNTVFYAEHHKVLERLFKRCDARIACDPKDQNQIYGYIVYERITGVLVVHYCYVKQPYRRLGLCHQLLLEAGRSKEEAFAYTHETFLGNRLSGRFRALYNPYVIHQGYEPAQAEQVTPMEGNANADQDN
jgi:hypothetical protein